MLFKYNISNIHKVNSFKFIQINWAKEKYCSAKIVIKKIAGVSINCRGLMQDSLIFPTYPIGSRLEFEVER